MRLASALLLIIVALPAAAGTIVDLQTGAYAVGDLVVVDDAVVTAVRDNGVFISEAGGGPYTGVWVYTGTGHDLTAYTTVDVAGYYEEYYDATEINVVAADTLGYALDQGVAASPSAWPVTIAELNADPEAYESCFILVTDGMIVTEIGSYGEWTMESAVTPGEFIVMDDFWEDPTRFEVGTCSSSAIGIYWYSFGAYKLEPFYHGVCICDCTVGNEERSFGEVKNLFR